MTRREMLISTAAAAVAPTPTHINGSPCRWLGIDEVSFIAEPSNFAKIEDMGVAISQLVAQFNSLPLPEQFNMLNRSRLRR